MKKRLLVLTLMLILLASTASASGNVTIAVQGRNGFEDEISKTLVYNGRLLLFSDKAVYAWTAQTGLERIEGFAEPALNVQEGLDGTRSVQIGDERIELEEQEQIRLEDSILSDGGKLYRMAVLEDEHGATRSLLVELVLEEDAFTFGRCIDLTDTLIEDDGDYASMSGICQLCKIGGTLYMLVSEAGGQKLFEIDPETGDINELPANWDGEITGMIPFGKSGLLFLSNQYDNNSRKTPLMLYLIDDERLTNLGALTADNEFPQCFCYDETRGILCYVMDGCAWRVPVSEKGVGEPEAFGDIPLVIYSSANAVLLDDLYVLSSREGVVGRDVTAERVSEQRLTVADAGGVDALYAAYFDFNACNPQYAVLIDNGVINGENLIQSMLTQSSAVDLYIVSSDNPAFSFLLKRGYMAELGGSEALRAFADGVYPAIASTGQKDGELYVDCYTRSRRKKQTGS